MSWDEKLALYVPQVRRVFLVCAPNEEQAERTVKAHAVVILLEALERQREDKDA